MPNREVISAERCLDCGHHVVDHRKGSRWGMPKEFGRRDWCIGDEGRCLCRRFRQPHETQTYVVLR